MKKLFKSIVAAMLCAVIAVTALGTETAQAAETPVIKITFNKKSVNLKVADTGVKETKYKTLKKKLGKATTINKEGSEDADYYYITYTWKKGKSQFSYNRESFSSGNYYGVRIQDKNVSICGTTKGTKADKAKKAFEKAGAATVNKDKNFINADFGEGSNIQCTLKNGKIIEIYATLYY